MNVEAAAVLFKEAGDRWDVALVGHNLAEEMSRLPLKSLSSLCVDQGNNREALDSNGQASGDFAAAVERGKGLDLDAIYQELLDGDLHD